MQTNILTPLDLFNNRIQYTIPDFQRRYVWEQERQWEPFWDDVQKTADDYLERLVAFGGDDLTDDAMLSAQENAHPHFMGAVVLQQVPTSVAHIPRREVIDGQQRMTTIQLLLDAVQYVFETLKLEDEAEMLSDLVENPRRRGMKDDDVFKLWPTDGDREAFRHAMLNGLDVGEFSNSLIVQAHDYFQRRAKEWLADNPDSSLNPSAKAKALLTALTALLQMVVIELNSEDDPYIIFETLNARGTPLLESDLIKNFVMSQVAADRRKNVWGDLDDQWWSEEITQGRLIRPRKEALLNYWLVMRKGAEVNASRVFSEFRFQAERSGAIENLMSDVRRDLGNYRRFMDGDRSADESKFHYRVNEVMEIRAITPAFLMLLSAPPDARVKSLKILESYLVRGMLYRGNSQGYNRMIHELVGRLRDGGLDDADKTVLEFLGNQTAYNMKWPDDREIENRLYDRTVYRVITRSRLRMILEAVEERLRENSLSEHSDVPKGLTIEHVMPRSWEANWPIPSNLTESERAEKVETRNWLIHTIGNLTLVNRRLNPALSNAPWEQKRDTLRKHSVLLMNDRLLQESEGVAWDEEFIQARSRRMAKIIAEVWPGPDSDAWG